MPIKKPVEERFWTKVKKDGPRILNTPCWVWIAGKDKDGYGTIRRNGKKEKAHRFSYALHNAQSPGGLFVCHRCDNPSCVNPKHLFTGTAFDNKKDCANKKRHGFGERNGRAKLTERQVLEIRSRNISRRGGARIAREFGISTAALYRVMNNQSWRHLK